MKRESILAIILLTLGLSLLTGLPAVADAGDDPVVIKAQTGGNQVVDVKRGSMSPKAVIQTWRMNGTSAQSFVFADCDGDRWCALTNLKSSLCLEVKDASTSRGASVRQEHLRWERGPEVAAGPPG